MKPQVISGQELGSKGARAPMASRRPTDWLSRSEAPTELPTPDGWQNRFGTLAVGNGLTDRQPGAIIPPVLALP